MTQALPLPPAPSPAGVPARRETLLDAADRVVQRDGPAASMTSIAREAGITKPILYRWFGDKGGLYRALAERHVEELLAELRAALGTANDRRGRVLHVIDTYLRLIESRPQVYRFLMHRASVEDPDVRSQVATFVSRLGDEVGLGIRAELSLPDDRAALAQAWGHAIVGMVQAAGDWWLEHRPVPRRELAGQLTDLLWGGYASAVREARPEAAR